MTRPPKTYPITLDDACTLADIICEADGAGLFASPAEKARIKRLAGEAHAILARALGDDQHLVYGHEPEAA